MRISLVQLPPMPIGPLTLAAVADQIGFSVELIDFPARGEEQEFGRQIAGADVVGFSTVCTKYPRTILLAKRVKALNPTALVVFGGPHATTTARETLLLFPFVDLIIRGEAEIPWSFFLEQLKRRSKNWSAVPGAVWREDGQIFETACVPPCEDLDAIPVPKYGAYPALGRFPFVMTEVGRGCPYACTFCCTNTFFSRQPRMKSPERIVVEMDHLHRLYGTTHFDFVHDMFTYRAETVRQICSLLRRRRYRWGCSSRTDTLSAEMLDVMKEAGCIGFYFGIESGSPRMQKLLKKHLDVSQAVQVIKMVKQRGFGATVSVIFGFPQETRADIKDSLLLVTELMSLNVDKVQLPVWGPLAGTPLTQSWQRFEFDGELSNFADTDGALCFEEEELIRDSFRLFSTFYYPVGTEYNRADYLALTVLLEELAHLPLTRQFILEKDGIGFVSHLMRGQFDMNGSKLPKPLIAEMLLRHYARTSRVGDVVVRLLEMDKTLCRVAASPVGWREQAVVGAAEAHLLLPRLFGGCGVGFNNQVSLWLTKHNEGVRVSLENGLTCYPGAATFSSL